MSQRSRTVLATAALLASLFLVAPSPSHAAAHPWSLPLAGSWERAWSWLAQLLPGGAPRKPTIGQRKEGPVINPDGGKTSGTTTGTAPTGTQSNEGPVIDPNGAQ
jgi:hypothetical protein